MIVSESENYCYYEVSDTGLNDHYTTILARINLLSITDQFLFLLNIRHVTFDKSCEPSTIATIKNFIKLAKKYNRKFILILEDIYEAPSYRYNLKNYVDSIAEKCNIPLNEIIIWSGALHQFDDPVKFCVSYDMASPGLMLAGTSAVRSPEYHFISLARLSKPHRQISTVQILDRGLDKFGSMSLGCGYYINSDENNFDYVPEKYRHFMPLVLDEELVGLVTSGEFSARDRRISYAFINLVQETSYDWSIHKGRWNLPFITEKTIKPFAWGQVPIFIAPLHTVSYIRKLGYDLFDDLIDHTYDSETDPFTRISLAINQLEKICNLSIKDLQKYKLNNLRRFIKNRQLCSDFDNVDQSIKNLQAAIE